VVARVGRSAFRFSRCQTWRLREVIALTLVTGRPDSLNGGCDVASWHLRDLRTYGTYGDSALNCVIAL